ncbi:MAG: glucose-6-phosphate isomerase [Chloroflexi bacterium]|nr:glucose-6-phosphate isomerase [Chloroflexota bacterium]
MTSRIRFQLGAADREIVAEVAADARRNAWAERLFAREAGLWTDDLAVQREIAGRLGWLDVPERFTLQIAALEGFGDAIREAGFSTAVVMGMGGSSLAPLVLHRIFGTTPGYLDLRVLDSTDPSAVAATVDDLDPLQTLWIFASKSGTTTEPLAFLADARSRLEAALDAADSDQRPGEFLVAITDPGRSLESIPGQDDMRERFLNPPDVGGRYSALTYVGLVPASLIGLDLDSLLASASGMLGQCREPDPDANPGVGLGVAIGALAKAGRDKLTFLPDAALAPFGAWAEQLLAESTGKHGVGIVPVVGEPPRAAAEYASDRVFVELALSGGHADGERATLLRALARAGQPVIRIELDDPIDLGGEFVRWEVATAIAGAVLGIDPFDQPNVEDSKERTRRLLAGQAPGGEGAGGAETRPALRVAELGETGLTDGLRDGLAGLRPPAYVALQAFIAPSRATDAALVGIRAALAATGCATTAGYGPQFLHSTGQLHKGGPATGTFIQLTSDHPVDRQIPGWPYSFGRLIDAQARGDREALRAHDRPVIHVHLGSDLEADLRTLERAVARALG